MRPGGFLPRAVSTNSKAHPGHARVSIVEDDAQCIVSGVCVMPCLQLIFATRRLQETTNIS